MKILQNARPPITLEVTVKITTYWDVRTSQYKDDVWIIGYPQCIICGRSFKNLASLVTRSRFYGRDDQHHYCIPCDRALHKIDHNSELRDEIESEVLNKLREEHLENLSKLATKKRKRKVKITLSRSISRKIYGILPDRDEVTDPTITAQSISGTISGSTPRMGRYEWREILQEAGIRT